MSFTCILLTVFTSITAQTTPTAKLMAFNELTPKGIVAKDWSFFYDEENDIYYIDFEAINLNLTAVKVLNKGGKELIKENVADLPVNTIYELDCSKLVSGVYTVELHTYTEVLRQNVTIR